MRWSGGTVVNQPVELPQLSLQRYVDLVRRRRWQLVPVSLLGLLVGAVVAFLIPRYYVAEATFEGSGCAISKASASLMTGAVRGKTVGEAGALFERVHRLVTEGPGVVDPAELGKLAVLSGVCAFPTRVKCASLAWHALRAALAGAGEPVSTE